MAESYSVKSLLVHLREKLGTTTPPRETDQNGPPNVKEQRRKREQEQKRKAEKEKRRKDRERTNKDARPGSQTQTRNSAWSDRPADIPSVEWGKLREATRKKYTSHCHAYLIGKAGCTSKDCKHGSHSPPSDWRAFLTEQGF